MPYGEASDTQVITLVALKKKLLPRPDIGICDDLWKILNSCWARTPSKRPRITSVSDRLKVIFPPSSTGTRGQRNEPLGRVSSGFSILLNQLIGTQPESVPPIESDKNRGAVGGPYTHQNKSNPPRPSAHLRHPWRHKIPPHPNP